MSKQSEYRMASLPHACNRLGLAQVPQVFEPRTRAGLKILRCSLRSSFGFPREGHPSLGWLQWKKVAIEKGSAEQSKTKH